MRLLCGGSSAISRLLFVFECILDQAHTESRCAGAWSSGLFFLVSNRNACDKPYTSGNQITERCKMTNAPSKPIQIASRSQIQRALLSQRESRAFVANSVSACNPKMANPNAPFSKERGRFPEKLLPCSNIADASIIKPAAARLASKYRAPLSSVSIDSNLSGEFKRVAPP